MKIKETWIIVLIVLIFGNGCSNGFYRNRVIVVSPEQETEEEAEPVPEPEPVEIPEPMQEMPGAAKLTLVVYMAADNDLETHAIANLKDMEHADFNDINVLVLLDRAEGFDETNGNWTDTRLFEISHDETNSYTLISMD